MKMHIHKLSVTENPLQGTYGYVMPHMKPLASWKSLAMSTIREANDLYLYISPATVLRNKKVTSSYLKKKKKTFLLHKEKRRKKRK
jgi:hypothetical protein